MTRAALVFDPYCQEFFDDLPPGNGVVVSSSYALYASTLTNWYGLRRLERPRSQAPAAVSTPSPRPSGPPL